MTPAQLTAKRKGLGGLGLTQTQLATELGLTLSAISKMEKGHRPIELRTVLAVKWLLSQKRP